MKFFQTLLQAASNAVAPQLSDAKMQLQEGADQLALAFEVLIGEGIVIILLLVFILFRKRG
jgi:pilus assembly protein TadC